MPSSSFRQQSLLSDEQAREVEAILSNNKELPPLPKEPRKRSDDEPDWLRDVLGANNKSEFLDQSDLLNQTIASETSSNHQDSLVSMESTQSANESNATLNNTTTSDSLNISKFESNRDVSVISSATSLVEADASGDESLQMEYPPKPSMEVFVNQDGVHFFEDGNFWMEVPGLLENDRDDEEDANIPVKKGFKIKFSTAPIQVFSTFSVNDYDRRNEDVDPVAASAEYELEKRVEKMHVFPVELMKGQEGLGLSIIGSKLKCSKLVAFIKYIFHHFSGCWSRQRSREAGHLRQDHHRKRCSITRRSHPRQRSNHRSRWKKFGWCYASLCRFRSPQYFRAR